jgi:Leucine-rich repeat (LRR) protein
MENLAGPRLLQAFFDHAPKIVFDSMDNPSKAALRLSCKNAKAFEDGTVTTAKGEACALEAILHCDWQLSELYIKRSSESNAELSRNVFLLLFHAVCSKFPLLQLLDITAPALYDLPANIGQLSKLRTLKIKKSRLEALPASFGQLSSLERLELYDKYEPGVISKQTIEGLAPLKQLTQLKYLNLGGVLVLKCFFSDWLGSCHFPVLEDLILSEGLQSLPSSISNFRSLTALIIEESDISEVPESIFSLKFLKKLSILGDEPVYLPTSLSKLTALESLDVTTDTQSFALVEHLTKLTQLTFNRLEVEEEQIIPYPEFLWTLTSLQSLHLFGSAVPSLPDALGNLKNLEWLCLRFHYRVEKLPETIRGLKCLTSLQIFDCPMLLTLPESVGNLKLLRELSIQRCYRLTTLPESIGQLQSLEKLKLEVVKSLENLPSSIGNLRALKELIIHQAGKASLPETFADLVLDKPAEECSLQLVSFINNTHLQTDSPRIRLALTILRGRGVLRCQIQF